MSQTSFEHTEQRSFSVHPSIIKTLIHEQAGSLTKAVAELVMNSVDAEASLIEIEVSDAGNFVVRDNGRGFTSKCEIERFFETFGTPHDEDDAHYGRFRIGRGQIMSYASTVWRSGRFEMRVDLKGDEQFFGYQLIEHEEEAPGCTITGKVYDSDCWKWMGILERSELSSTIRYVPVPVTLNGVQVNEVPAQQSWDYEDDHAWYRFDNQAFELRLFNRGVHVCNLPAREVGVGGVATSKSALHVNLARNAVITHRCETWWKIAQTIREEFTRRLYQVTKLKGVEAMNLLHELLFSEVELAPQTQYLACCIRFIPDVFGELKAPKDFLAQEKYTLFDGVHMGIAERVQREGLATVIMPDLFHLSRAKLSEGNAQRVIPQLRERLDCAKHFPFIFIPFAQLVKALSDTSSFVSDKDLPPEELLVLKLLRSMNREVAQLTNGKRSPTRKLIAGVSDCMDGWTDGVSYIAINRRMLKGIRGQTAGGSSAKLIALLVHEYAHLDGTLGEHHHDREFYVRYHEATMRREFGLLIDKLFQKYIAGIAKLEIVPSGEHRSHLKRLSRDLGRLRGRLIARTGENV
ncbi:ATP-binding protein [Pseudomonas sp. TSRC2-2]|uniref:ATP-binding protein n=1 Tax=Pseudomonas sp. TSRC2-2 TaxID=2804571 RepID=UPI003CF0A6C1